VDVWLTLASILQSEISHAELFDIFFKGHALGARVGFGDECVDVDEVFARHRPAEAINGNHDLPGVSRTVCYDQLLRGYNLADGLDALRSDYSGDKGGVR